MPTRTRDLQDLPRLAPQSAPAGPRFARLGPRLPRSLSGPLVATLFVTVLAGLALAHHRSWLAAQDELAAQAQSLGLAGAELAKLELRMRRESDATAARLALAARLFDLELTVRDPGSPASAERLLATRELARDVLRAEPASWEAAMLLGGAVSLERSRARDTRIFSLAREWERPLIVAGELAPAELQPRRLLAAAYLEVWPALTPGKRQKVEALLREAFLEPRTFERLYAPWVEIAGTLERAATLLPDQPLTWKRLAATALERKSWSEYVELTGRHRRSLLASLDHDLAIAGGQAPRSEIADPQVARGLYGQILAEALVDAEFAALVERVLGSLPPGPADGAQRRAADSWLAWAEPLCLVRNCPFSPPAMARLASLAGAALSGAEAAFVALAAQDLPRAELLERRSDELWSEPWAPYLTFKAKQQAARKEIAAARATLLTVHRAFRVRLAWRALAERLGAVGVSPGPELARDRWEAADWWFDRGASRLDLLPSRPAPALWLELAGPVAAGALLEAQWDGRALPPLPVAPGATTVRLAVAVTSEPHLLEIRVRAGDLRPAVRVRLE